MSGYIIGRFANHDGHKFVAWIPADTKLSRPWREFFTDTQTMEILEYIPEGNPEDEVGYRCKLWREHLGVNY